LEAVSEVGHMEKIKARIEQKKNIYVHNDLSAAASFFKQLIDDKITTDECDGLTFYQMACAVMLAFTFEAKINFLGHKLLPNWQEKQRLKEKVKQVLRHLGVVPDWKTRPYSSMDGLRRFRDSIAHGKPVEIEHDETVQVRPDELDRRIDLTGEWESACTPEKLTQASSDLEDIWKDLLERSGLSIWDTRTSGESGITIEKITVSDAD
jgi:hypothetical protein